MGEVSPKYNTYSLEIAQGIAQIFWKKSNARFNREYFFCVVISCMLNKPTHDTIRRL